MIAILAVTVLLSACGAQKKYMHTAFDMIKSSFPNAKTTIVDNKINIIFPENDMFDVGSSDLKPKFDGRVVKFAGILNKYTDTKLNITGHTDKTGDKAANLKLSQARAMHVLQSLANHGVSKSRMADNGVGESQPIADNTTAAGRAENRRVAFQLYYSK